MFSRLIAAIHMSCYRYQKVKVEIVIVNHYGTVIIYCITKLLLIVDHTYTIR